VRKSSSGSNAQGKKIVTIRILYTPVGLVSRYINGNSLDESRIPEYETHFENEDCRRQ
jgi:hypothetical protein